MQITYLSLTNFRNFARLEVDVPAGPLLIPAVRASGARILRISSAGGASSMHLGRKFGFAEATPATASLLADPQADAVVIGTRHDTHADFVLRAHAADTHNVFVADEGAFLDLDVPADYERAQVLVAERERQAATAPSS